MSSPNELKLTFFETFFRRHTTIKPTANTKNQITTINGTSLTVRHPTPIKKARTQKITDFICI
jgi:hypothetical protein